jgi:hypothetical protein
MKSSIVLALGILGLWAFPRAWYTRMDSGQALQWWVPLTNLPGWYFQATPVDGQAERLLVADQLITGEYTTAGESASPVRLLMARRNRDDSREIGLFVHTPDRCWVQGGWNLKSAQPDHVEVSMGGRSIGFERRVFEISGRSELVYFAGLVAGQTLPYRLDHNYSVSRRVIESGAEDRVNQANRWNDSLLWRRVWDSFVTRRPLLGPKQFLRVSTPVAPGREEESDRRLQEFLQRAVRLEDVSTGGGA